MIRLGIQGSIGRGFARAVEDAAAFGLNTLQVFSRSPVGGQSKGLPPRGESLSLLRHAGVDPLLVHAPYFMNPAAEDPSKRQRAVQVLTEELARGERLAASYLVLHAGHRSGSDSAPALEALTRTLAELPPAPILLENAAGQGREVGLHFDELARVMFALGSRDVGILLDTAHAIAAGWALRSRADWHRLLDDLASAVGLDRLRAIHLNDNPFPPGARRDRHSHLLAGHLGRDALSGLVRDADRYGWPLILETPGRDAAERADDIAWVRALIQGA